MLLHIMKVKTTLPVHRTVWRYGVRRTQIFTIYMGQAGMKAQLNLFRRTVRRINVRRFSINKHTKQN